MRYRFPLGRGHCEFFTATATTINRRIGATFLSVVCGCFPLAFAVVASQQTTTIITTTTDIAVLLLCLVLLQGFLGQYVALAFAVARTVLLLCLELLQGLLGQVVGNRGLVGLFPDTNVPSLSREIDLGLPGARGTPRDPLGEFQVAFLVLGAGRLFRSGFRLFRDFLADRPPFSFDVKRLGCHSSSRNNSSIRNNRRRRRLLFAFALLPHRHSDQQGCRGIAGRRIRIGLSIVARRRQRR